VSCVRTEKEKHDLERIHHMTEDERRQEQKVNPRTVTNKAAKGKYKFLQKYYHRGAFFLVSSTRSRGIILNFWSKGCLSNDLLLSWCHSSSDRQAWMLELWGCHGLMSTHRLGDVNRGVIRIFKAGGQSRLRPVPSRSPSSSFHLEVRYEVWENVVSSSGCQ